MSNLLNRLRAWLSGGRPASFAVAPASLAVMGREIASTQDVEYDCNDVYRLLDQFAEAVQRGEDGAPWMPLIRAHLERCPDCGAEFEALMRALRPSEA
jgi:predicted component of type VI protein secretion system